MNGKRLAIRLREVIERCGLGDCSRRLIGNLSRGYRQRTGLADCLLHEPEVLLLDEPLAALDPAQAQAIRTLLRNLGGICAVIFSTHVLAEAEQLCDRALVLNAGHLAAADSPAQLVKTQNAGNFEEAFLRLTTAPATVTSAGGRSRT